MSNGWIETHKPCPCGKSSDGYSVSANGWGKCFVCDKSFKPTQEATETFLSNEAVTIQTIPWRGISALTMTKYGTSTKVVGDTPVEIAFKYPNGAYKVRTISEKKFRAEGEMSSARLFGKNVFNAGQGSLTIFEGEMDAMSGYQMLGTPCVSVRSASSAVQDIKDEWEYVKSFHKIYLCFDNDKPGTEATSKVASLLNDNGRVFLVKLTKHKDANEYLVANEVNEFKNVWHNAKRYLPDNIISSFREVENALKERRVDSVCTFPFKTLQEMTYGIRLGEATLFTALEGIGKTEIIRSIEHHVLKETDFNVGIIHLEESKDRTIRGLVGYEMGSPVHLPDSNVSDEEVIEGYKRLSRRDERVHIYSHFGSDDPDTILSSIRFLVSVCDCRVIFLDHISILVSGLQSDDERRQLDYISTQLKMMAEELQFALIFISHVNDNGDTRGSRNISKVANTVIHMERDKVAPTEEERNKTYLIVKKNRFTGMTGPAGYLVFDRSTFIIREPTLADELIPKVA